LLHNVKLDVLSSNTCWLHELLINCFPRMVLPTSTQTPQRGYTARNCKTLSENTELYKIGQQW